jgi:thiol-disulfide isomerase/thioredoxin
MNKMPLIYLFATLLIAGCKKGDVQVSGTLASAVSGEYILLTKLSSNALTPIDSIKLSDDGTFKFKTKIEHPAFYVLKISQSNFLTMVLEPGEKVVLKAHKDSLNYPVSITGSAGTELLVDYNNNLRRTIDKFTGLNEIYMQNSDSPELPAVLESLDSMAQNYLNEINTYTKEYIDNNLSSLVSLVALYQQVAPNVYVLNPTRDLDYFIKVDSSLSRLYPEYEPVNSLHQQVQEMAGQIKMQSAMTPPTGSAAEAPEIALPTPEGDTIKLSSTRGSIVLLDFWAAWCAPCRQENPNLVKAYNTYRRKGFQIYQVSLDKSKDAWVKGIEDDQLGKWIHVSDIQYWNSIVVPLYHIESIPHNLLLDKEGRVIASNLRGEKLQEKLAEIFD